MCACVIARVCENIMADCCYKAHTHLSTVGTAFKHSSTSFFQSPLGEGGVCYTVCCLGLSPYKSVPSIVVTGATVYDMCPQPAGVSMGHDPTVHRMNRFAVTGQGMTLQRDFQDPCATCPSGASCPPEEGAERDSQRGHRSGLQSQPLHASLAFPR